MQRIIEETFSEEQHVFFCGRSTIDLTFIVTELIDKHTKFCNDMVSVRF